MVAVATVHRVLAPTPNAREAILAIVGGTLLTIVLTRPKLRWLEDLTESSTSRRRWAERGLSALAFVIGGYAWATLFLVLQTQLGSEYARLVKGAGILIAVYAALIHFEPFIEEWRRRGAFAAGLLYVGCACVFVDVGISLAETLRSTSVSTGVVRLLVLATAVAGTSGLAYLLMPKSDPTLDEPESSEEPLIRSKNTARVTVTRGPTRTPARSTRA